MKNVGIGIVCTTLVCILIMCSSGKASARALHELAGVPHCDNVTMTRKFGRASCYLPTQLIEGRHNRTVRERQLVSVAGPTCQTSGTVPGLVDTTTLCDSVPNQFQLPPAYSATLSRCEVWYVGTAAWAVCNADYCQTWTDTAMSGHCTSCKNSCVARGYPTGYLVTSYPTGFERLYDQGYNVPPPVYPGYC